MALGPGLTLSIDEKRYPQSRVPVFAGLNIAIAPGSVTAILGPSGIGKSTLLRIIAGIDRDFAGSAEVGSQPAASSPVPGFVFQDPRLLPWLTALDNVRTAGPGIDTKSAMAALDRTGLADAAHLYPRQLSGGMQRRAALARAIALNAGLLLLDEPFVSLDQALVGEMYDLMTSIIAAENPTVVLVTHMAEDAARLADRIVVLSDRPGRIAVDMALPEPRDQRDRSTLGTYIDLIEKA